MAETLTDKDLAALLAYNPGFTPTTSGSGNLNLLQDIYSMAGDPVLAYQQGLITPQLLLQMISDQTKSTVYSFEDTDYQSIENRAMSVGGGAGDEVLLSAFAQIREGMSLGGVQRWLLQEWGKDGLKKEEEKVIDALLGTNGELAKYEERWLNSQNASAREKAGELTFDSKTGNYIGQMDDDSARDVLKSFGFSGLLAQPAFWKSIPDDTYIQKALADEVAASSKYDVYQDLSRKLLGSSTSAAQSAYTDFLSQAKPDRRSAVVRGGERGPTTLRTRADILANEDGRIPIRSRADVLSEQQGNQDGKVTIDYGRNRSATVRSGGGAGGQKDNSNAGIISRLTPQEQDYWAKLAASYAGRAVQTEGQGKVSSAKAEVDKLIESSQENRRLAEENAFNPALALLAKAPLYAASLSTPAAKPAKAKPRTLSDQEIETMASMIAGGFAG
jgi:hypothetical protein